MRQKTPPYMARASRGLGGPQESYDRPQRILRVEGNRTRCSVRLLTRPVDSRHDVRCVQTPKTAQREESFDARVLHQPPENARVSRRLPSLQVTARDGIPTKIIVIILRFHDGMRACVRLDSGEPSRCLRR